jgi:hypothetical protein
MPRPHRSFVRNGNENSPARRRLLQDWVATGNFGNSIFRRFAQRSNVIACWIKVSDSTHARDPSPSNRKLGIEPYRFAEVLNSGGGIVSILPRESKKVNLPDGEDAPVKLKGWRALTGIQGTQLATRHSITKLKTNRPFSRFGNFVHPFP